MIEIDRTDDAVCGPNDELEERSVRVHRGHTARGRMAAQNELCCPAACVDHTCQLRFWNAAAEWQGW